MLDDRLPPYLRDLPRNLRSLNWPLLLLTYALAAVGLAFIYGTGSQTRDILIGFEGKWLRQLLWVGLGTALMLGIAMTDYKLLNRYAAVVYAGTLLMLILVLIPGIGKEFNGARSWFRLAGVSVQPAEFAKWGALVSVAALAGHPKLKFERWTQLIPFAALAGAPMLLILAQPDMGSAMVIAPVTVGILLASEAKIKWFVTLAVCGLLMAPIVFFWGFKDYQRERVMSFGVPVVQAIVKHEWIEGLPGGEALFKWEKTWHEGERRALLRKSNWNVRQSQLAVGSGGLIGKGYMQGTQNTLGFLPRTVAPTDFIFSVIAEETGFLGSLLLLSGLGSMLIVCLHVSSKAEDAFGRNLCVGVAALFAFHIFINIGMTIGVVPVIGIPLPLISYGGSFMWLCMACVGLVHSVHIRRKGSEPARSRSATRTLAPGGTSKRAH